METCERCGREIASRFLFDRRKEGPRRFQVVIEVPGKALCSECLMGLAFRAVADFFRCPEAFAE